MGKNQLKRPGVVKNEKLQITAQTLDRRMFLGGAGSMLMLPFLSSLLPEKAWSATENDYRKAFFMPWAHGVYWKNWQPSGVAMNQVAPNVMAGSLANATLGAYFPDEFRDLRTKMSVVEGLDLLSVSNHMHNTSLAAGGHAGGNDFEFARSPNSLDVILSKSTKVYASSPKFRVLRADPYNYFFLHCYENGRGMTMDQTRAAAFFKSVFGSGGTAPTPTPAPSTGLSAAQKLAGRKKLLVDSAIAPIQALLQSSKISTNDRAVASNFFDYLRDTQTRINADVSSGGSQPTTPPPQPMVSCGPTYTAPAANELAEAKNVADTIVLALACGLTKLAYMPLKSEHDLVHNVNDSTSRAKHVSFLRDEMMPVPAYVMKRMDSITEANGKTLLDNSAVLLCSDLGSSKYDNHNGLNVSTVIAGGLNGMLRQGQHISYFNRASELKSGGQTLAKSMGYVEPLFGGRPYNEALISIMRGFGLTNEYVGAQGGFGVYDLDDGGTNGADATQKAMLAYYNSVFLPSYGNKNVGLPYFYLGT